MTNKNVSYSRIFNQSLLKNFQRWSMKNAKSRIVAILEHHLLSTQKIFTKLEQFPQWRLYDGIFTKTNDEPLQPSWNYKNETSNHFIFIFRIIRLHEDRIQKNEMHGTYGYSERHFHLGKTFSVHWLFKRRENCSIFVRIY